MSIDSSRPVRRRRVAPLAWALPAILLAVALGPVSLSALPQEPAGEVTSLPQIEGVESDLDRAHVTTAQLLEIGRALSAWARDARIERGAQRARRGPAVDQPKEQPWDRCPAIERGALEALLVPAYLRELPATDAWGHPFEFCLDRRLSAVRQRYGVRSAGADGTFEGGPYPIGAFPEIRLQHDLVWMDGAFVRWPEPQ